MHKWQWRLGIAALLVALYGATRVYADWLHLPVLLSTPTVICDAEPRSAISADGGWLASVWIQGRKINNGCVNRGAALLRWATEDAAQTGWSSALSLALPDVYPNGCFVHTDVALDGSIAHIAATLWSPCDLSNADSALLYYTCNLAAGACSAASLVMEQLGGSNLRFSDTRIVLDSQNRPHIVYGRGDHALAQSKLFYTRNLGEGWSSTQQISPPDPENAYRPALAASNGRIHITWEYHRDYMDSLNRLRQRGDVRYRYCAEEDVCGDVIGYPSPTRLIEPTYPIPNVAARGDRVILTWNVCADVDDNPPCNKFYLVYARSNNNGTNFAPQPREVGTELEIRFIDLSPNYYAGDDSADNPGGEYATHLNPAIALDPAGLPYLVWQMQQGDGYVLTTTHAISATASEFTWAQEGLPQFGDGNDNRVYPALTLATDGDTQALHLAYMRTWRENQWSRAQIFYDVASSAQPTIQLNYTERISALPQERAQVISARVQQQNGAAIANVPVIVKTSLGSFEPSGYGVSELATTTDAHGAVTLTLYSNLTGTAHVSAWIDSEANASWDSGEPSTTLTQTWVFNAIPSVHVAPDAVEGGQWITATIRHHPYADLTDPYASGKPVNYEVWWCPVAAPAYPLAQQLGPDFQVDIDTWGRSNMPVRVPLGSSGTYRIETHRDLGEGGAILCDNTDSLIATSITLTSTFGAPTLTVSPGPVMGGQWMTATVRDHPYSDLSGQPLDYYLWWCPVTAPSAPTAQQVGAAFQVGSETWARIDGMFRAPFGVNGTYRLETHNAWGETACENADTRVAVSNVVSATSDYPGPIITLDNDRPYPNTLIAAMVRLHDYDVYDVWWCTSAGKPVEQRVVAAVTVNSDATPITVRVPTQVSGLYHLESHTSDPGAGCGNDATYFASSPLIWPYSKVYLPLVMRNR